MNVTKKLTTDTRQQQQQQSPRSDQVVDTPSSLKCKRKSLSNVRIKSSLFTTVVIRTKFPLPQRNGRQSENEITVSIISSNNNSLFSVASGKIDDQNTTPYNTRGSARSRNSTASKLNSDTTTDPLSAPSRQLLPFMDNVADQENRSTSVGDNPAPVASTTPKSSHQSQPSSRHPDLRPATPFSLRKQIELALELSRDCKCALVLVNHKLDSWSSRVRLAFYFSSKCSTDKNTFEMDVQRIGAFRN